MWARLRRLVRELSELPGWPNVQVDAILLLDDALAAKWQSLDRAADRADDAAFTAGAAAGQTVHAGPAEPSRVFEFYAGTLGAEERAELPALGDELSLRGEIALLRVSLRQAAATAGSYETVCRIAARLIQALKVERELRGEQPRGLDLALDELVDR